MPTEKAGDGEVSAATVNWVTQTSFDPPLVAIGVKADFGAYQTLKKAGCFALNFLGKGQQGLAFTFSKPAEVEDGKISGETYRDGSTESPLLASAPACVEYKAVEIVERGDHHIVVGEAVNVHAEAAIDGCPDDAILHMRELGDNVFYGGLPATWTAPPENQEGRRARPLGYFISTAFLNRATSSLGVAMVLLMIF